MNKMLIFRNGNGMKFSEVLFEGSLEQCREKMRDIYNTLTPAPYAVSIREACAYSRRKDKCFANMDGMSDGGRRLDYQGYHYIIESRHDFIMHGGRV